MLTINARGVVLKGFTIHGKHFKPILTIHGKHFKPIRLGRATKELSTNITSTADEHNTSN